MNGSSGLLQQLPKTKIEFFKSGFVVCAAVVVIVGLVVEVVIGQSLTQ